MRRYCLVGGGPTARSEVWRSTRIGFQEVTHESWFARIGGAIKGVVVGLVIFAVSFPLLFWNEGRAVQRYKTLVEGAGAVVSAAADSVDAANEGALVRGSAATASDAALSRWRIPKSPGSRTFVPCLASRGGSVMGLLATTRDPMRGV